MKADNPGAAHFRKLNQTQQDGPVSQDTNFSNNVIVPFRSDT